MFSNWFTFEKSQPDERKKDICLWSSMWEMFEWEKLISRLMLELYMLYLCCIFEPNFSNFSSVQTLSRVRLFATPWIAECQASLSITNSQSSLKLTSFSFCPQSLPASVSFPMTQLFAWGGQSTGVSASASFPPKKSQGWSPSEWTDWSSLQSKGLSRVFSNTTLQKHQFFWAQLSSQSNSHIHTWPQEKP